MTIQTVNPFWLRSTSNTVSSTNTTVTNGQKYAMVMTAKGDITIKHVDWYMQVVTVAGANTTIRIETVDSATDMPTGTLWGTNTNGVMPVTAIGVASGTLTSAASISDGQRFAVVLTVADASANFRPLRWTVIRSSTPTNVNGPLYMLDTGSGYGSLAHNAFAGGFRDAAGDPIRQPDALYMESNSLTAGTLRSSYVGARISFPVPVRVCGAALNVLSQTANNAGDITMRVYDSSTAPGGTPYAEDIHPKQTQVWSGSANLRNIQFSGIELAAGDHLDVIAIFDDSPGAGDQRVQGSIITTQTAWRGDLWRGMPTAVEVYDNAGSWATEASMEPDVAVMISGFDDGAGGGGGTPNLTRLLQQLSGASLNA